MEWHWQDETSTLTKTCPTRATSFTVNPTQTDMVLNSAFLSERSATALLSIGTAYWRWLEDWRGAVLKLTVDWVQLLQCKNQKRYFIKTVTRTQVRTESEFLNRICVFISSASAVIYITRESWTDWIVSVRGQIHKTKIKLLQHIYGCLRFSAQWINTVNTNYKVTCSIRFRFLLAVLNLKMLKHSLEVTEMTDLLGSSYSELNV